MSALRQRAPALERGRLRHLPRRPTVSRLPWEAYSAWLKYHLEAFSANYSNGTGGAQRDDKQTGDDDSGGVGFALAGGGGVARVGAGEAQGGGGCMLVLH